MSEFNKESSPFNYNNLTQALEESVKRNLCDGLLLSGGLDTAILAYIASKCSRPFCITVALQGAPAPDVGYAKLVANDLGLRHYTHFIGNDELNEGIQAVIRIMKSFDPMEIRNDVAIYIALKVGRDHGLSTIMTGDASDELFSGYSFLFGLTKEQLDTANRKMWANMRFASIYLSEDLALEVKLPFLDPAFKALATGIDANLKVRSEAGQIWGKWILRKAFEHIMPQELVWRVKAPIEVGSGTTMLPNVFDSRIPDLEFAGKGKKYYEEDGVTIRSKEHLFYYEMYRGMFGVPCATDANGKRCPYCGVNIGETISFCRICGAYSE